MHSPTIAYQIRNTDTIDRLSRIRFDELDEDTFDLFLEKCQSLANQDDLNDEIQQLKDDLLGAEDRIQELEETLEESDKLLTEKYNQYNELERKYDELERKYDELKSSI